MNGLYVASSLLPQGGLRGDVFVFGGHPSAASKSVPLVVNRQAAFCLSHPPGGAFDGGDGDFSHFLTHGVECCCLSLTREQTWLSGTKSIR